MKTAMRSAIMTTTFLTTSPRRRIRRDAAWSRKCRQEMMGDRDLQSANPASDKAGSAETPASSAEELRQRHLDRIRSKVAQGAYFTREHAERAAAEIQDRGDLT